MRLTDYQRHGFVRAVMNDIPQEMYLDRINTLIQEDAAKSCPEVIRSILVNKQMADKWLIRRHLYISEVGYVNFSTYCIFADGYKPNKELLKVIGDLQKKSNDQALARSKIEKQLYGQIKACTTLKAAQDMFPEKLHKYLPKESSVTKKTMTPNLPVTVNIMESLVEMGWPKQ